MSSTTSMQASPTEVGTSLGRSPRGGASRMEMRLDTYRGAGRGRGREWQGATHAHVCVWKQAVVRTAPARARRPTLRPARLPERRALDAALHDARRDLVLLVDQAHLGVGVGVRGERWLRRGAWLDTWGGGGQARARAALRSGARARALMMGVLMFLLPLMISLMRGTPFEGVRGREGGVSKRWGRQARTHGGRGGGGVRGAARYTSRRRIKATKSGARTSVTFIEATPAKWNVLSVICVPGSPIDCAPTAPTVLPAGPGGGTSARRAPSGRRPPQNTH